MGVFPLSQHFNFRYKNIGFLGWESDDITKELIGDNWLDWLYCMEKMVSHGNLFLRLLLGGMGVTGYINVNIHLTIICS